ncbi:hypothetical protein GUITHDRAFT_104293 [Guillardia theta CCMP2712]|uniref:RWP-RK domain-containing protein n=1 Tax=Guillardia theta (strain CCMP2712) TaxID=905079 RepID=L1JNX8_GUITC|nr:hypothetical protein GUITHDRAFT_104293 [Guillardia theta CCMP2712]EKX49895.1 hypothetical protein GUITHDRAFT_104293 [Guillardia theta CCMP2712]|eukprot:XP_005836875.1 hypothetical protein GUITHDRAFT_104293 [Guillardia theta CCMP2712]
MEAERVVTINARSRHGLLRKIKSVQIDLNLLSSMFHMRQDNAARSLGVSLTSLKIACRRLGLSRWPYNGGVRAEGSGSGRGEGSAGEGGAGRREEEAVEDEEEGGEEDIIEGCCTTTDHDGNESDDVSDLSVKTVDATSETVLGPVLGVALEDQDSSVSDHGSDHRSSKYMDVGDVQVNVQWLGWYMNCDDTSPVFQ